LLLGLILLLLRMLFVDRVLPHWPLHLDRDLNRRLVDGVVVANRLYTAGQHLDPQLTVRHTIKAGLAVRVRLDLQAAFRLLTVFLHRMHDHAGVADRFAAVVANDDEVQDSHVVLCQGHRSQQNRGCEADHDLSHSRFPILSTLAPAVTWTNLEPTTK